MAAEKNFWLWGTWGKRNIKVPFLTQKVQGRIRDVIIGHTFIIALQEDGQLVSWGEDKAGCLGLGTDYTHCPEPRKISFPTDFSGRVLDIQYGKHHILALTNKGQVYAWGENPDGQLGLNDCQTRYEPTLVEELSRQPVIQILAVDNMSYALTKSGTVYAWGDNKEGSLALEHDNPRVMKPEPMMRMNSKESPVKKLQLKESGGAGGGKGTKTVVAFVELAEPLTAKDMIGGFDAPLGEPQAKGGGEQVLSEGVERDIFEGVDLMRRVMDNTQDWWNHMLEVRHGAPYSDNPTQADELTEYQGKDDHCTPLQLDTFVSLDILERASYELDMLIQSAKAQLLEVRNKKGTKNVKFMLSMFMDDCKLRREKIRRTVSSRQFMDLKKSLAHGGQVVGEVGGDIQRLGEANKQLQRTLTRARNMKVDDIFTKALQDSVTECIECKLVVHETQIECIKAGGGTPSSAVLPALKIIKERWGDLKRFSIYNLYQECSLRGQNLTFNSDDEMLAYLVESSDQKIDQIIRADWDRTISRDTLVPDLCYDLLVENAELRKMCNTYQLKVMIMRDGRGHGRE
eukprot:CAMPEP_0168364014 /NCGR_PEP_ID=MMETSP0228-20121227/3989_1 /TAXON_ID=133427 /ORGANISM="Protoceratium reticulatum, Strain CCCM 535 (=CCMP 1889)" /LENGTH=570 /DNA_ID=CAMNT_0008376761 /DNA_START=1 /DNA_END=1710 /DNA_ORIENTATION=+